MAGKAHSSLGLTPRDSPSALGLARSARLRHIHWDANNAPDILMTQILWAVVASVRGPSPALQTFVDHHLGLGAAEVLIYLDDPSAATDPPLGAVPLPCDAAHWDRIGGRPTSWRARQTANAEHAAEIAQADWLLHVEVTDFLFSRRAISDDLTALSARDVALELPLGERVWIEGQPGEGLFDGAFRLPLPVDDPLIRLVYGHQAPFLHQGLVGPGAPMRMIRLRAGVDAQDPQAPGPVADHAKILRFNGLTPRHWLADLRQSEEGPVDTPWDHARQRQVDHVHGLGEAALAFHRDLFHLSLEQAVALDGASRLIYARLGSAGAPLTGPSPGDFDTLLEQV